MLGSDLLLLKETLRLAERGRYTCAPNPTVGCIVVRGGEIIGRGFHAIPGQGHAEVEAIKDAGGDVAGATVYVSLEPCAFVGRTPACAQTLVDAGVARVVLAAVDPHPQVSGQGVKLLEDAGIAVEVIELEQAQILIRGYASRIVRKRPWVRLKTATSIDGAVALSSGESQWITGPAARAEVQQLRARSDAIITGVGTVVADDPRLTARIAAPVTPPLRVILDSQARTPHDAQVVTDGGATLIVHNPEVQPSLSNPNVECLSLSPRNLEGLLVELAQRGCNEVLVEAGPQVVGSFIEQGLWDEWVAFIAPKVLGSNSRSVAELQLTSLAQAPGAVVKSMDQVGEDMRVILELEHG